MTAADAFDAQVAAWLHAEPVVPVPTEAVDTALSAARAAPQRRGIHAVLTGPGAWPAQGLRRLPGRVPVTVRLVVLAAILVAMLGGAAFAGSVLLRADLPQVQPTPAPDRTIHVPILLRPGRTGAEAEVVAAPQGTDERVLHQIDGPFSSAHVSQDGWLAIDGNGGGDTWTLQGLVDDARTTTSVPYAAVIGGAWSPTGGRFATITIGPAGGYEVTVTDATTGVTREIGSLDLPGSRPDLVWAQDGSGLLVRLPERSGGAAGKHYGIQPIDGGPVIEEVPALAFRHGPRAIAAGGAELVYNGTSAVSGTTPAVKRWFDGLAGHTVKDAGFSADGAAVWLLLERMDGDTHVAVVARADGPGRLATVATIPLGRDVTGMWFEGFAPDDEAIAIGRSAGDPGSEADATSLIVSTADGSVSSHAGRLIGWVQADLLAPASPAPTAEPDGYAGTFETVLPDEDIGLPYPPRVTALTDGRVLALAEVRDLEIWDPATGRLTRAGATITDRTTGAALVPLEDGHVLIVGGDMAAFPSDAAASPFGRGTAELFDPDTGVSSPLGTVGQPWLFGIARLADGGVLVAGGQHPVGPGDESPPVSDAAVFDPAAGRFESVGAMTRARSGHTIVPLLDGGALVVGGSTESDAERYDPATRTFSPAGAMSDPGVATAVRLLDGRVLVIHGWCGELQAMDRNGFGDGYKPVATEIFDPASNSFTPAADLPHCVSSATVLPNGEVLVEGFWGQGRPSLRSGDLVGPGISWSGRLNPITGEMVLSQAAGRYRSTPALLLDGSVLLVGGVGLDGGLDGWAVRYR